MSRPDPAEAAARRAAVSACRWCDEHGWVTDSVELYGWAVRCRHTPDQRVPVKEGHRPPSRRTTP